MKKILAIGGAGFIGSAYVKEIRSKGYEVEIYDLPDNDILDMEKLKFAILKNDLVIHFAAMADVTKCIVEQDKTFEINIYCTYKIGQMCAEYDKELIFISTCCVYGNSLDALEEEWKTAPMSGEPYAVSKVAGEYILRGIPNLKYVFARVGTVYGIEMREALFTYIVLNSVLKDKKIYIDGDGQQTRQLVHIDDLVDGLVKITEKFEDIYPDIFNLCGEETQSALDCVEVAEQIIGKAAITENRAQRYGQTFRENISIEHAKSLLGWKPQASFYEAMRHTFHTDERFK